MKQSVTAIIVIFIVWSIIDFIVHNILLTPIYIETKDLWRPVGEMKIPLMYGVTFIYAACFVLVYKLFVAEKSVAKGIQLGAVLGVGSAVSMGFGSYSYMPIPLSLALSWCATMLIEFLIAGLIAGLIVKSDV